ncbi:hypothetical protein BY996DRAFT_2500277 [Phakopsora pachyrhizi]|nr:hypothetical protein BY996DRAFT_2500277 [Phakopsora pachyrhizi]
MKISLLKNFIINFITILLFFSRVELSDASLMCAGFKLLSSKTSARCIIIDGGSTRKIDCQLDKKSPYNGDILASLEFLSCNRIDTTKRNVKVNNVISYYTEPNYISIHVMALDKGKKVIYLCPKEHNKKVGLSAIRTNALKTRVNLFHVFETSANYNGKLYGRPKSLLCCNIFRFWLKILRALQLHCQQFSISKPPNISSQHLYHCEKFRVKLVFRAKLI